MKKNNELLLETVGAEAVAVKQPPKRSLWKRLFCR
jgi:hypothetical protein